MKVLVLEGGTSAEREVSLRSAKAVKVALVKAGHEVVAYDTKQGLDSLSFFTDEVDVTFPVLHGTEGEDGVVQAELEMLGMPFVGADAQVSALCFDKVAFKERIAEFNAPTPKWVAVTRDTVEQQDLLNRPFVLKPAKGGSSVNTHIVRDPTTHALDFDQIFSTDGEMLLEELIAGDEITVAVLVDQALPTVEIIPPEGAEFDYENKYNGATQELCPPENVASDIQVAAQQLAEQIHTELGVRHLSRTDFMIKDGELWTLELNTIPGLTDESLYPKAARAANISMKELVDKLVRAAASD
jgi:D-alanine-D-alanine ligase